VTLNKFGWALRASRAISPGAWITQYGGRLLSCKEMGKLSEEEASHVKGGLGGGMGIDGFKEPVDGLPGGSFANHSCTPNAKLVTETNGVFLRAIRYIGVSCAITINYHHAKGHGALS
jgi:hypothetical protein